MNIFWMDTVEGAKIPLLMVKHPLSIDNVNTDGKSLTERIELAREWFEATNDELWRFMTDLSIGNVVYENGRKLTLKEQGPYDSPVIVVGHPSVDRELHESFRAYTWRGVAFIPENEYQGFDNVWRSNIYFLVKMNSTAYSAMCRYGKPEETPMNRNVGVVVLIRDTTGRVKPVLFNVYNAYNTAESNRFKVAVSSIDNDRGGFYTSYDGYRLSDEFWQAQKGAEPPRPKGGGIVDITDRFSPRTASSSLGIYPITTEQLTNFSFDMWTTDFLEKFIMNLYGKPIDSLISLRWYYGILGAIKRAEKDTYLTMGNVAFRGGFAGVGGTEIITKPAISEYITFTCGEVLVERHFNNFLDMSPFTKLQVFLPYIGFVSLDATEFMGKYMRLDYNINIITGAAVAYIYVRVSENNWRIAMQIPCTVGIDIPLSFDARESIAARMVTGMTRAAGVGLGVAAAVAAPAPVAAGAAIAAGSMVQNKNVANQSRYNSQVETINQLNTIANSVSPPPIQDYQFQRSGGMDSETGSLGYLHPFLLITRPIAAAPEDYDELVGNPDFRSGKVSSFNGYIKVGSVKNKEFMIGKSIPRQAMNEIEQLLRGGVYTE